MPDNPFQTSFWDDDEQQLWDEISAEMVSIYLDGVDGGVDALPPKYRILADFDRVNDKVMDFANEYRYSWIKGITDTTRKQTQQAISKWISSGSPLSALEAALEPIYGDARAARIASTEVTRVYAVANQAAWESTGLVDSVQIMTAEDDRVCPICSPLSGTHVGIGDIDAMPPFHVGCRCWTQPVVSERAFERQLDEIFS